VSRVGTCLFWIEPAPPVVGELNKQGRPPRELQDPVVFHLVDRITLGFYRSLLFAVAFKNE
jgi:hypothetical protein